MSQARPTVCMLTTGFPRFKGDLFGTFVWELAAALARDGVEVEVVAPHEAGLPRRERMGPVSVRRFVYVWPRRWQCLAYGGGIPANLQGRWAARLQVPLFLLGFALEARRACRRADIVHCHWSPVGWVGLWAAGGRPVVLSVRGSDTNWLEKGLFGRLLGRVYHRVAAVVGVSRAIVARLERLGVEPKKLHAVANGVDPRFAPADSSAARQSLGLPAEGPLLLFVGLLAPVKGVDILLQALERLQGARWHCVVVGDGGLRAALEAQAAQAGLKDRVRFVGARPSDEIPLWMNAADALVLPSRSEGRPNVVLEAQACALPVVATRVGGTPELVEDGDTGLLVDPDDVEGLAGGIERVLGDAALRRRLGEAARKSIASRGLTWEASAAQMHRVYRAAAGEAVCAA